MNKTAIKNFAIWARNKLIADISYKAGLLGITEKGITDALPQSTGTTEFYDIGTVEPYVINGDEIRQRSRLVELIERKAKETDYKTAYNYIIEEVAYTWFNRLIAIRFMEVNDYLPSHIRVLSSENGKTEPDLVTNPFDSDLEYTEKEKQYVLTLKQNNNMDELFNFLFVKQCNALNKYLPELFEKTNDYTELLLNISITDKEGLVAHLVNDIDEDDFNIEKEGQVEIIGWMYQYYISDKHDEVIDPLRGKSIKKEDIPAATQLFTTDWVVHYMVDNSLGRYWIERHPESKLADKLPFFVPPKDGKIEYINEKVDPKELTFFDPCMGSGHILVYAFDVLMEIYREVGYTDRDAAVSILENNLFGLDIDQRAYQLAYFATVMKARSYNRRIFSKGIKCNIAVINESNGINKFTQENITLDRKQNEIGEYLIDVFRHAKEIGSLQTVTPHDYGSFREYVDSCEVAGQMDMFSAAWYMHTAPMVRKLIDQAEIMSRKYTVVCTNPPYLAKLDSHLKDFVNTYYKEYSGDLFSVFMYRNFDFCKKNGYSSFMTPNVWMSIKSYQTLREYIMKEKCIVGLVQMAHGAFNEVACVDVCAFTIKNNKESQEGTYIKLSEFKGNMDVQGEKCLEAISGECEYKYYASNSDLMLVPGSPITAFCASAKMLHLYEKSALLEQVADPKQGIATSDNNRFLRQWFEVDENKLFLSCESHEESMKSPARWYPYNKGGNFRKWYGNNDYVVDWEKDGFRLKNFKKAVLRNPNYYFKECISWSLISSYTIAFRYKPVGHLFDVAGMSCFQASNIPLKYLLALNNSCFIGEIMMMLAPTINYQVGNIANIPVIYDESKADEIITIVDENISLAKADWDTYETSWDFKRNPLVSLSVAHSKISDAYEVLKETTNELFKALHENELQLNDIFLDIYDVAEDVNNYVSRRDVSHTFIYDKREDIPDDIIESYYVQTKESVVKHLISYAVGCIFGRYSLDCEGLAFAGGNWDDRKYSTFVPDKDNCIPITDEEYFEDDIIGLLCAWLKKVYGEQTIEENLTFIAEALGNKGKTSREIIRNYFLNDFIKDHIKMYQKRPIYWMFDSGKKNGFKALVYMHRWDADTIGNLRIDYLHRAQRTFESEINRMQDMIDHSTNNREVAAATKRKEKLQKQLKECREYDEKIGHLALSRIGIDLDDGVKTNYEKVQTASDGKKYQVLAKI